MMGEVTKGGRERVVDAFQFALGLMEPPEEVLLLDQHGTILSTWCKGVSSLIKGMKTAGALIQDSSVFSARVSTGLRVKETSPSLMMVAPEKLTPENLSTLERIKAGFLRTLERFGYYEDIVDGLNAIDEGMSLVDKDGQLIFANQSCYNITEATPEMMVGYPLTRNILEQPVLMRVLEDGEVRIDFEYRLTFNGKKLHLINSAYPIRDGRGNIQGAIDVFRDIKRSRKLVDTLAGHNTIYSFDSILGESDAIVEAIETAKRFALSEKSVLIQGESGVGKELFAQSIHNHSQRSDSPFVALNCANIPSELIDSELFGYEEGAFTGARKKGKQGKFELAQGGTVFLDEIGELPLQLQAKLLRVLETKQLSRIGSNKIIHVDIRILAATHKDLDAMVRSGQFRADLLYRLRVLHVMIPPLRERLSDIPLFAELFMAKLIREMNLSEKVLTPEAFDLLMTYPWPGNVRELESMLARVVCLSEAKEITASDLRHGGLRHASGPKALPRDLTSVTREHFLSTLESTGGNKKKTAEILGVSRPTVYRLIEKFGVKN